MGGVINCFLEIPGDSTHFVETLDDFFSNISQFRFVLLNYFAQTFDVLINVLGELVQRIKRFHAPRAVFTGNFEYAQQRVNRFRTVIDWDVPVVIIVATVAPERVLRGAQGGP